MAFCGQCGQAISGQTSTCPRCGTPVDNQEPQFDHAPNDVTVLSQQRGSSPSQTPAGFPITGSDDATYISNPVPQPYPTTHSHTTASGTPQYNASQPGYMNTNTTSYPGPVPGQYPPVTTPPTTTGTRYPKGLLITSIVLLIVVLGLTGFLLFRMGALTALNNNNATPTPPSNATSATTSHPTATPEATATTAPQETPTNEPEPTATPVPSPTVNTAAIEQAKTVVQQYYGYINAKQYQAAYDLWYNYPQDEATFAKGFENTENDELTINDSVDQGQGNIQITVTVIAIEKAESGGTQQKKYQGHYLVGQPTTDGDWKILQGQLNPD